MSCGCWCPEEVVNTWFNIVWACWVTVDTVTQPWDVIVSSKQYNVTSPDWSITVTPVVDPDTCTTTFQIEKDCCADRLVAVAPECTTWGTIKDVIKVDTTWPLTWTQNWCSFWELWFDVGELVTKDEKVKRKQSCTATYWNDLFVWWTWISLDEVWCRWRINVTKNQFVKPMIKSYLLSNLMVQYAHWNQASLPNNWWFPIYTSWYIDTDNFRTNNYVWYTIPADPKPWSIDDGSWNIDAYSIPKTWYYRVRANANIAVNRWVEATRVALIWLTWWDYACLLNVWFANSNNYSLAEFQSTNTPTAEEWRVWNWCASSDIVYLEEWDEVLWLFWRMNNMTLGWPWTATTDWWVMNIWTWPFWFNPFWAWNQTPANPQFAWTYWGLERVSHPDWDTRFYQV